MSTPIQIARWGTEWGNQEFTTVPKQISKLSFRAAKALTRAGRHSDGDGLYLNVTANGAKSWLFLYNIAGRRREMGMGSFRDVTLARARALAGEARQQVHAGRDPLSIRIKPTVMTFGGAADALIKSMSSSWRNAKHRAQWTVTLRTHGALLTNIGVGDITTDDVLGVLQPGPGQFLKLG